MLIDMMISAVLMALTPHPIPPDGTALPGEEQRFRYDDERIYKSRHGRRMERSLERRRLRRFS